MAEKKDRVNTFLHQDDPDIQRKARDEQRDSN